MFQEKKILCLTFYHLLSPAWSLDTCEISKAVLDAVSRQPIQELSAADTLEIPVEGPLRTRW